MDEVDYAHVDERDLGPGRRAQLSGLLLPRWLARPGVRERAWTQQAPLARVVASLAVPVGQASVCALRDADPCILGIGDLVVAPPFRRRGIGSAILREAVELADERGAEVIVAASRGTTVRRVLGSLGFRPCKPHEMVFRQGDLLCWNETWIVRGVDVGDLVEIVGDV